MKIKLKTFWMLFLFPMIYSQTYSQSIYFNFIDGTSTSYNVSDVKRIDFSGDTMNLRLNSGQVNSWSVNTIGKYLYSELPVSSGASVEGGNLSTLTLFPNPACDFVKLNYYLDKAEAVSVFIIDLQGKIIKEEVLTSQKGINQSSVNIKNLASGIYQFRLKSSHQTITKQLLKQ